MREAEAREADIRVIIIGPLALREIGAIDSQIDHHTTRTG
jgi:hypothetical protein